MNCIILFKGIFIKICVSFDIDMNVDGKFGIIDLYLVSFFFVLLVIKFLEFYLVNNVVM